ncbi:MAG: zf-HC2 domain-containing protein [Gemmatimonadota bacterium]|nr:zf-HC2 domain-containing protein [Gemmatimonadota bacterium]
MDRRSPDTDHPVDALPEYARGIATDARSVERHLESCEDCRAELEILRMLHTAEPAPLDDIERQRIYRSFEERRGSAGRGARGSGAWLRTTWRVAAAVAVLLTSVGVWQVARQAGGSTDWSPELALEGWQRDLADLEIGPSEIRVAFGVGRLDEWTWEDVGELDPYDLAVPWEDGR